MSHSLLVNKSHDQTVTLRAAEDVAEQTLKTMQSGIDQSQKDEPVFTAKVIKSRWAMLEGIGSGGFGSIFKALDTEKQIEVAIKVEKRQGKCYLDKEVLFYSTLEKYRRPGTMRAAPRCHYSGVEGGFKIAVFDLMGESLSDLFYRCGRRFSLKCVLMLAQQLVSRLESVHEAGIVHRDVKPGNFVMGRGEDAGNVYVIDFGLSNLWRSGGRHITFNNESPFRGTHRYASVNSHLKYEQSRRDDLEAIAYVLIYFLKGGLPWQSLKVSRNKRRKAIGKCKASYPPETLCVGLPAQFAQFLIYVKALGFEDTPDYQYCRDLFRNCFEEHGFEDDGIWDWDLLPPSPTPLQTSSLAAPTCHSLPPNQPHYTLGPNGQIAQYRQAMQAIQLTNASTTAVTAGPSTPRRSTLFNSHQLSTNSSLAPPHQQMHPHQHSATNTNGSNRASSLHLGSNTNSPCVNLSSPLPITPSTTNLDLLPKTRTNLISGSLSGKMMNGGEKRTASRALVVDMPHYAPVAQPQQPPRSKAIMELNNNTSLAPSHLMPHHHIHTTSTATLRSEPSISSSSRATISYPSTSTSSASLSSTTVNGMHSSPNLYNTEATTDSMMNLWPRSTYLPSPVLGSTADSILSPYGTRMSASSPSMLQRTNPPTAAAGAEQGFNFRPLHSGPASSASSPLHTTNLLIDLEDEIMFSNSNMSLQSSTSAATSASYSALSSSSTTLTASAAPSHHSPNHSTHHILSTPGSPSSSTRPESPMALIGDGQLWNTNADALAEASYVSNGTTTTDCGGDQLLACSLNISGSIASSTPASCDLLATPSHPNPVAHKNPKKRSRNQSSDLNNPSEPISKRRSARLLEREAH